MGENGRAVASMCSLNRMPGRALATIDASVALRTSSGSVMNICCSPNYKDRPKWLDPQSSVVLSVLGLAAIAPATPAFGADPSNGQRLAHRWCEACHVVTLTQRRAATDQAPPFAKLRRHPTSTLPRSLCSCSTLIRRCRIWDYLGQKQQTSRHILQRSNSSATKGLGGFEIVSAPTKRVQTYLARMEMRKKLFQEITAQQSSDKVRLLNAGRLIQMCTTRWSHDRLFAELTRIQGVNPRERGGIIEDDWRPCPEGNRRTHRQILAAAK